MIQPWRTLNSHHVLREPFLNLRIDQCELPDGRIAQRYCVLEFPGDWVNVVAITTDNQIILTRQYRHAAGAVFLETVGGGMEPTDASPADAARRELRRDGLHER